MVNMDMMLDNLINAQDNNETVTFSYFINGGGLCIDITIVPDVMLTGSWVEITDKVNECRTKISFSLDKEVKYDPELGEFSMEIGDAVIVIAS